MGIRKKNWFNHVCIVSSQHLSPQLIINNLVIKSPGYFYNMLPSFEVVISGGMQEGKNQGNALKT
jgi:hypothetical protein